MIYVKVKWIHEFEDEPVWIYLELNNDRFEVRKIEVFPSGECGFDDGMESKLNTGLGDESVPDLKEIAEDAQFAPYEIKKEEFELMWSNKWLKQDLRRLDDFE